MSVNDRGTIKWTAMMMPEHVELLNQLKEKQNRKQKPILDEQQFEENGFQLMIAHKDNLLVNIKYYSNYDYHNIKGYVDKINYQHKYVSVVEKISSEDDTRINFDVILEVTIL
ncbi:YolD-like family protein [Oceanobacillus sp. 1P07AA]|uniref:YolD-like family protein n=1 Tax=Oceanobacillus sp. 1P07AA TaxID=3132293 RepID=UPI0039A5FB96